MKIVMSGLRDVKITMTIKQFRALRAAVDYVASIGEDGLKAYRDVIELDKSLGNTISSSPDQTFLKAVKGE